MSWPETHYHVNTAPCPVCIDWPEHDNIRRRPKNHRNQHGPWAQAAKRRGEEYRMCNHCGGRAHPRVLHPVTEEPVNVAGLALIAVGMLAFWVVFLWMLL